MLGPTGLSFYIKENMKVAFYKGSGLFFDKLTRTWTQGQFSHCELVLQDSLCASSSFRDKGVRFKEIDFLEHPERWVFIDISFLSEEVLTDAWDWFEEHEGDEYDVLGLLGFMLRFYRGRSHKRFCSEAVAESLGFEDPWRYDPNTLYVVLRYLEQVANAPK